MYNETVIEHFKNPRNAGEIKDADGIGMVGNPACGDVMKMYIIVKDNCIVDIKHKTFGCGAAIACSSKATEMVKGKTLDEAKSLTREEVAAELNGLPPEKMSCSNLAPDAIRAAIGDYQGKTK
ncbi:MAG: iron-sulfur cluster assembly scaffold protein [Candidatus Zixiibacteriota bacterium]